jgi:periplasmic protein CpxP/Spy
MVKKVISFTVIAGLATIGILATGCARQHFICKTPEKRAEIIVKKLTNNLDLTKEQVEKLNKIKDEVLSRTKNFKNERKVRYEEALALLKSEKLDKNALNSLISKREQTWNELKPFLIDKFIEFHGMLTTEQKNKLAEKMEKLHHYCD